MKERKKKKKERKKERKKDTPSPQQTNPPSPQYLFSFDMIQTRIALPSDLLQSIFLPFSTEERLVPVKLLNPHIRSLLAIPYF